MIFKRMKKQSEIVIKEYIDEKTNKEVRTTETQLSIETIILIRPDNTVAAAKTIWGTDNNITLLLQALMSRWWI